MRKLSFIAALATLVLQLGCGYHAVESSSRLPTDVHTIAIPTFENKTQTYRIEQVLTESVVREFNTRTNYRVQNEATQDADATLHGTVISTQLSPLTYDSQTGRASSALVTVNMKVTLTDKSGKVLFENPNYTFREQYQISREISSFFAEDSPAVDRLSRDFARALVSSLLEGF